MKEYLKILLAVIITFGVSISAQSLMANWAEPGDDPPNANPEKPINVSMDYQMKTGGLGIGGNLSVAGKINMTPTTDFDIDNTVVTKKWFLDKMPSYTEIYYDRWSGNTYCPADYITIGARSVSGTMGVHNPGYVMCLKIN